MKKLPIFIAAIMLLSALTCAVFARPKTPAQTKKIREDCADDAQYWRNNCIGNIPPTATGGDRQQYVDDCNKGAESIDLDCLRKNGVATAVGSGDAGVPIPPKQGQPNPTATPRKGPGQVSGKPKSNPTSTPRPGPGKTGTSGIGHSSPTPTPSGPILQNKSEQPSPTPHKSGSHN